jgi:ATP phosphoribosyltransferase regulatory subunit
VFLPVAADLAAAAKLRAQGWATVAALCETADVADARLHGCSHLLHGAELVPVDPE